MTLITKISLGTFMGIGAVGGLAVTNYLLSGANNLKEELISANLTPLSSANTNHSEAWQILAKKYATKESKPKIGDFTIKLKNEKVEEEELKKFQEECEKLFIKKPKDTDYKKFIDLGKIWCVKEAIENKE